MGNKLINIIPNGTTVETKIGKIKALVIAVCVRGVDNGWIEYQISYFKNGERTRCWLEDFEITPIQDNSKQAGFQRPKTTSNLLQSKD